MATKSELVKKIFDKVEEYKKINADTESLRTAYLELKETNDKEQRRFDEIVKDHEKSLLVVLGQIKDGECVVATLKDKADEIRDNISSLENKLLKTEDSISEAEDRLIDVTLENDNKMSQMSNEANTLGLRLETLLDKIADEITRHSSLVRVNDELEHRGKAMMIQQSLDAVEYDKLKSKLKEAKRIISKTNGGI
jgi:vacuolar-type H+-ATPase subunit I/STV1